MICKYKLNVYAELAIQDEWLDICRQRQRCMKR